MSRPKLIDKKGKIGISINKDILVILNKYTKNKSKFIEDLLINYFKGK